MDRSSPTYSQVQPVVKCRPLALQNLQHLVTIWQVVEADLDDFLQNVLLATSQN